MIESRGWPGDGSGWLVIGFKKLLDAAVLVWPNRSWIEGCVAMTLLGSKPCIQSRAHNAGSHGYRRSANIHRVPTLPGKPGKPGILSFSFPDLEFAQKVVKTWNCKSKPGKMWNWLILCFKLFKMSFTKIILIYFFVISTLSTQTLIRSQIDLRFHCFYLEITWKENNGILCHKRSGNPAY